MKHNFKIILWIIFAGNLFVGCSDNNDPAPAEEILPEEELLEEQQELAFLSVKLVDAPGDYEEVLIDLTRLEILMDETRLSLELLHGGVHDLLWFTGGGYENLVYAYEVPAGKLSELELVLGDNNELVLPDQTRFNLNKPQEKQEGLAVSLDEHLNEGDTLKLVLDFNVDESIIPESDGSYSLAPVLRITNEDKTGHIYGYLAQELEESPALIYVVADTDTIKTQTYYGEFMLWGLPEGSHDITFNFREDSGLQDLIIPEVIVEVGEMRAIGPLNYD